MRTTTSRTPVPLEMWAGVESTVNGEGNQFRDQLQMLGHDPRPDDATRIADLGVRTVRWPILWERHRRDSSAWTHTARMLTIFRKRGVRVIASLMHHGCGSADTHLLDPEFPNGLARFASEVATRFPWIDAYTPVNEPLATAGFTARFRHRYPHVRDDRAFVRALLHQVQAIQDAMTVIKAVNPSAELIATEHLGYTHATPVLRYQAAFENARRWLTWDLLLGQVQQGHPLWRWLRRQGTTAQVLERLHDLAQHPIRRPSLLGINYHFTSERYLDEASHRYPTHSHDRNRWHRYADVDAVRARHQGGYGPQRMLEDTASRYGLPVAMTASQLSGTREQQMLWLHECWNAAQAARARGFKVRAVTAWALFGSLDWNSLLTKAEFHYESGAFDVRSPAPRATALVPMIRALSAQQRFDHPALDAEPWWKVPTRFTVPTVTGSENGHAAPRPVRREAAPLLIVGARGTLGSALWRIAAERGLYVVATTRNVLDMTNPLMLRERIREIAPWAIINAAGWEDIDEAEVQRERCHRVNVIGAEQLARAAAARGIPYCTFSSDLVFGQASARPFLESDQPAPCNEYGRSKATAERRVLAGHEGALIVRTSACFGDWDRINFVTRILHRLAAGEDVHAPDDAVVSPTYVPDLGHAVLDLLIDRASGIWHLANIGACSWFDLATRSASLAGLDPDRVHACRGSDVGWTAPRPAFSVLGSERATLLRPLEEALAQYLQTRVWERIGSRDSHHTMAGSVLSTPPDQRPGLLRDQA